MGIKDAKAVTTQYAGMERVMRNPPAELKSRHTRLTLKGFTKHPLQKKFLAGNKSEIRIDTSVHDISLVRSTYQKGGQLLWPPEIWERRVGDPSYW